MNKKLSKRLINRPFSQRCAKVTSDKPAYKEKKKTDKGYVWIYDEKHVEKRWKEKKEKLKNLEKNLRKVRDKYQKDLTSDDDRCRAVAAIVGIMDDTAMRIGNEESAKEGTYGATTLKVKHVKGGTGKMTFDFPGKGAIEQNVVLENNKVIKVVRDLMKGKKKDDFIFEIDGKKIWDRTVNRYLKEFDISAKDLRGFHANRLMKEQLKKKDFKEALEEVAEIVGHEPSTLKNQYLDPELVEKYEGKEKKEKDKKKNASFSIRAVEPTEQELPIGKSINESPEGPITVTDPDELENLVQQVDINRNVNRIGPNADIKDPSTMAAWRIIAPFLPEGATLTSAFRDEFYQAEIILEYWRSWGVKEDGSSGWVGFDKETGDWGGYYYKNFNDDLGIGARSVRILYWNATKRKKPWNRFQRWVLNAMVDKINSETPEELDKPEVAKVGQSGHQTSTAFDISGANRNAITKAVHDVVAMFPQALQISEIRNEKANNAVHIEMSRSVIMPPAQEYATKLQQYQSKDALVKRQSGTPLLSKRAKLTPEDVKWIDSIKYIARTPQQDGLPPIIDVDQELRKDLRIGRNVKLTPIILDAWKTLQPFLPPTARMTSGKRFPDDQRRIIRNYWFKATGQRISMEQLQDQRLCRQLSKLLKQHHGYILGAPVLDPTKTKFSHARGNCMDISGGNLYEIDATVRAVSKHPGLPVKMSPLIETANNCIHTRIQSASYDRAAVVQVLQQGKYASNHISKRAKDDAEREKQIKDIYEDLTNSNAPDEIIDGFEKAFGIKTASEDMGFGIDDMMGDWFEKAPIFRWKHEEEEPEFDIHDISESEASKLCDEEPEKFFYRGLHKEYPELESKALKKLIEDNAKFFFIFKYHEREEEEFQNMIEQAAEFLSQQDVRAFFYYHLHHKFPELGRGAIVQLIDTNPDSFFDLGLQKDYPDYEESAGAARNIKDPHKVELEMPEWLDNDVEKPISLRDRNASKKLSKRAGELIGFSQISMDIIEELRNLPGSFDIRKDEHILHVSGEIPIRENPEMSVIWTYADGMIRVILNIQDRGLSNYYTMLESRNDNQEASLNILKNFLSTNIGGKAVDLAKEKIPGILGDNVIPLFKQESRRISKRAADVKIDLTEQEEQIFDLLRNTIKSSARSTTLRVAGGWVRDKIMGRESDDIDIAVDNMSGVKFAELVKRYADMHGEKSSMGVIQANPEQSKHLETAVVHLLGRSIDFVNLRTEKYDETSRIPQIVPTDSPEEDAHRRDLTINALFYNINTGEVEDFVGGLDDIKEGVIRTPIPPKETLMEDPLRALRYIRFASRYDFEIKEDIIEAVRDEDVQDAFRNKVSRERIEKEFRKIITGASDPRMAMELIKDFQLRSEVLQLPEEYEEWEMDQKSSFHELDVWGHTMETLSNLQTIIKDRNLSDSKKFVINLAALMHDAGKLDPEIKGTKIVEDNKEVNTYHGHEDASMRAAEYALRRLPGIRVEEIEEVKKLIDAARRVNPQRQKNNEVCNKSRKALGKFVQTIGEDWENAIDLAMADTSAHKKDWLSTFDPTYFKSMKEQVGEMGLEKAHEFKPILNGNEIMQLVNRKGGPWVGQLTKALMDWQLENPGATKEQAAQVAQKLYMDLGLDKSASKFSARDVPRKLSKRAGDKKNAGVFIKLPKELAKQFPSLGEHDDSTPHITTLYIGPIKECNEILVEEIVRRVAMEHEPFEITLDDKVTYFPATKHSDDCKVAKMTIISDELKKLNKALKKAILNAKVDLVDSFPTYKPHTTLEYMEPPKKIYDGEVPSGSCMIHEVEIWNGDDHTVIPLGLKKKTKLSRLAGIIDYPKKMYQEIADWAIFIHKTWEKESAHDGVYKAQDELLNTIEEKSIDQERDKTITFFLRDIMHRSKALYQIFKKEFKKIEKGDWDEEISEGLDSCNFNISENNDDVLSGHFYFAFPLISIDVNNGNMPVDEETWINFEYDKKAKKLTISTIDEKWLEDAWNKLWAEAKNIVTNNEGLFKYIEEEEHEYGEHKPEPEIYRDVRLPSLEISQPRFKDVVFNVESEDISSSLSTDFALPLRQYQAYANYAWAISKSLKKAEDALYDYIRYSQDPSHITDEERSKYALDYNDSKYGKKISKYFKFDISDTKQYDRHEWLKEKDIYGGLTVTLYERSHPEKAGHHDESKREIVLWGVGERDDDGIKTTIKHELIHMMQSSMGQGIKKVKPDEFGAIQCIRCKKKFDKYPEDYECPYCGAKVSRHKEVGTPSYYDPYTYQRYNEESSGEEFSEQHATSDVEFFARMVNSIEYMKENVLKSWVTDGEYRAYPQLFNKHIKDMDPDTKRKLYVYRFRNFLERDGTLKYLRENDQMKYQKYVRELYRQFDSIIRN